MTSSDRAKTGQCKGHIPSEPMLAEPGTDYNLIQLDDELDGVTKGMERVSVSSTGKARMDIRDHNRYPRTTRSTTYPSNPFLVSEAVEADEIQEQEHRERDRHQCRRKDPSSGVLCGSRCIDPSNLLEDQFHYCKSHDPRRQCQGISVTKGVQCVVICSNIKIVESGAKYFCYQHNPENIGLMCRGYVKTKKRPCQ
ncbi:hypothetical protein BGZ65_011919, partial [Modicella reniformis]